MSTLIRAQQVAAERQAFSPAVTPVAGAIGARLAETISVASLGGLQAAIDHASTTGRATVVRLVADISTAETILVSRSNVMIEGQGGDTLHDVGTPGATARTKLIWAGAAGGVMMRFASPSGAGLQKQSGGGCRNLYFEAGGVAGIGLDVLSWYGGVFEGLHFQNPTVAGIHTGSVATLGEAKDPQRNRFARCSSRHFEVAGGLGGLVWLEGDAVSNSSLNTFEQLDCQYVNGTAYKLNNADNNLFFGCRAIRAPSGAGPSIEFNGSNAAADQVARANIFIHFSSNGALPIYARGTPSFTHPSYGNAAMFLDDDNGVAPPTIEAGASCQWSTILGLGNAGAEVQLPIGENLSSALAARGRLRSTTSLCIVNGSEDHVELSDLAGANAWTIRLQSGSLAFDRIAGGGFFRIGLGTLPSHANDAAAATGGVPVGALYRNGSAVQVRQV